MFRDGVGSMVGVDGVGVRCVEDVSFRLSGDCGDGCDDRLFVG